MAEIKQKYDVVIVGAGVAGLNCALNLPREKKVLIICKKSPRQSDSYLAQGGICMLRGDFDYDEYYNDTMRAGHYENNTAAVECMIKGSRGIIADLEKCGVDFKKNPDGSFVCTREGGHTSPRILFHEDCTGKEITSKLLKRVKALKNVQIESNVVMLDIIEDGAQCRGVVAHSAKDGEVKYIYADYTVLATGGIGGAFGYTTNYPVLTGDSLAICLNHGVAVDHINYIQVHPTTLYTKKRGRRFLISESVRGEGAHLLDKNFNRFTDELQPRDVVKNAVLEQMKKDGTDFVWLDLRPVPRAEIESHFPQIVKRCAEEGYDVFTECIPVVPAIHYFMGGVRSDLNGRTTMPRLYAVGETCCNGVHGKNRLASNSLLESLLFAKRAALDIGGGYTATDLASALAAEPDGEKYKDYKQLLKSYKKTVGDAVRLAEQGVDINEKFKEKRI
ncbi:MAG: FAD-dependent oxidoreductase [Clostridia bacterium]|nr:FAD-dependent oxidoreductase [Clostridia bacterium]